MRYWDTSALLKLYALEPDSGYFRHLAGSSAEPVLSAAITEVEMLCALYRKEEAGDLRAGGAAALFAVFASDVARGRVHVIPAPSQGIPPTPL